MQSKHQNLKLPSELLVDIFKATDGAILESLPNLHKISSMLKQKEFEKLWINQIEFRMEEIDERIARLDEYRRRNEEIEEKILEKVERVKAKLEQNLRRRKANFLLFFILVSAVLIHHLYSLFK
uniref:Uncharacterized protein n=1 Tax=Meloidogyne enterolobii TaxID=390850 RepID=A0A6V7Y738_MELEN|nr:unnamed protein product [Meloidogyne enterolobii]